MKTKITIFAVLTILSHSAMASIEMEPARHKANPAEPQIVRWIGEIKDAPSDHTTQHQHELEFTKDDGTTYDIVDSPELVKLHHETEKNYRVEIEAQKTPRFLFWGGNLIVKNFKVLNETDTVPHLEPVARRPFIRDRR